MKTKGTEKIIEEFLAAPDEALFHTKTIAAFFRTNEYWVRRNNSIPRFKLGGKWMYKKSDIFSWIKTQREGMCDE